MRRSSEGAAAAAVSGAPGSLREGSRLQSAEGDGRAAVRVTTRPPPPPDSSAAPEVRSESLAASAVSLPASVSTEVRAVSLAASAALPNLRAESLPATADPGPRPWSWSGIPWMRLLIGGMLLVALGYVFYKWGLPILSEKVLLPIMRWEATSFGRPVLAIVLVVSLSVFPTVFLPSTPSMWLTGMIFGYGFGFLIIMVGTAIGMSIPYLIGSLFLHRFHGWLERRWPQQIALIKLAGQGGWFQQFRVVVLLRISPFPYALLNYAATITQMKFTPYICGSVVGMVPDAFVNIYSGRLILTLADLKYDRRRMTTVEIIYNVFSAIVAVGIGVGFTFYARRALDGIQSAEAARRHEPVAVPTTGSASVPRNRNGGSSSVPADVV
ncbi:uncharacterized protein LOC100823210 [Brachypodium distachyon]|uniref:VTT domain-containing protein n=2 Tax=Brachypodium distachyon TaxID=15368 RepID=I1GRZ2_BRADI|nr:uncharacterized protein LOC100823210 [Brachypodium distachyon]KQK15044.1 hypothetical protein BRADI_1g20310v3 [Brachypodium distachyon]|eukprot:XP_010229601.1 uncharacterized protein LOC100823210 [Brachypodium distachyon]